MEFKSKNGGSFKALAILFFFLIFLPTVFIPLWMRGQLEFGHYIMFGIMAVIDIVLIGIFWYMGKSSEVKIENGNLIYRMLTTKTIALAGIQNLDLDVRRLGGYPPREILILIIEDSGGRKIKIHIQFFENFEEFLSVLVKESGKKMEVSEEAKTLITDLDIQL